MRVYVGTTLGELADVVAKGGFDPPQQAHAVTPALREWYAHGDQEELEYAATAEAARDSLGRLAVDPGAVPRRVVVAADVPDPAVEPDASLGRSAVLVRGGVPLDRVAAVHVDGDGAEDAVRAAAAALPAAEAGDEDAAFTVDEAFGFELLWYARQEIPDLLG